jgi:hypothetical protein
LAGTTADAPPESHAARTAVSRRPSAVSLTLASAAVLATEQTAYSHGDIRPLGRARVTAGLVHGPTMPRAIGPHHGQWSLRGMTFGCRRGLQVQRGLRGGAAECAPSCPGQRSTASDHHHHHAASLRSKRALACAARFGTGSQFPSPAPTESGRSTAFAGQARITAGTIFVAADKGQRSRSGGHFGTKVAPRCGELWQLGEGNCHVAHSHHHRRF